MGLLPIASLHASTRQREGLHSLAALLVVVARVVVGAAPSVHLRGGQGHAQEGGSGHVHACLDAHGTGARTPQHAPRNRDPRPRPSHRPHSQAPAHNGVGRRACGGVGTRANLHVRARKTTHGDPAPTSSWSPMADMPARRGGGGEGEPLPGEVGGRMSSRPGRRTQAEGSAVGA